MYIYPSKILLLIRAKLSNCLPMFIWLFSCCNTLDGISSRLSIIFKKHPNILKSRGVKLTQEFPWYSWWFDFSSQTISISLIHIHQCSEEAKDCSEPEEPDSMVKCFYPLRDYKLYEMWHRLVSARREVQEGWRTEKQHFQGPSWIFILFGI